MPVWPKDNQTARNAFYGDPGKGQIAAQMVPVVPPFAMYYTDETGKRRIKAIQFHKKAAPYLLAALNEIWDYCQHDQAKVNAAGVSNYAGAHNHRYVRGSTTKWSNHAYAAAIDLNAEENSLGKRKGTMPQFVVDAFCRQGAMWGGWYTSRPDWMHFEFVDNGGRKPKSAPPVYPPSIPSFLLKPPAAPADEFDDSPVVSAPTPIVTPAPIITDTMVTGDPELYSVQKRLKARNYSPGLLDGMWGSGTSGALGGFINDRGGKIPVPTSLETFNQVRDVIKLELSYAEAQGWYRPVSVDRANADPATVAAVAPEVVPVRQNFLVTAWASFVATMTAIYNALSDQIAKAWDWFTDHQDDLPNDPSFLHTVWGYVTSVPTSVWIFAAAAGLGFLALNSRAGIVKITESVRTGDRQ